MGEDPGRTDPLTVLVADDDPALQRLMERLISRLGYRALSAGSGEEAFALAEVEGPVHLLVTDVALGDICGYELALRLARSQGLTAALVISGRPRDDIDLPPGMPFLQKPFNLEDFSEAVKQALKGR